MSEEDQKAFRMYGKVPQKSLLSKINKVSVRTFATVKMVVRDCERVLRPRYLSAGAL